MPPKTRKRKATATEDQKDEHPEPLYTIKLVNGKRTLVPFEGLPPTPTMASGETAVHHTPVLVAEEPALTTPQAQDTTYSQVNPATSAARPGDVNILSVMPHQSVVPQSMALSSICDQLGTHVPLDIKQKIWRNEFIDLASVLPKNVSEMVKKPAFTLGWDPKNKQEITLRPVKPDKLLTNIDQWTEAFIHFMGVYLVRAPMRALELLKYLDNIRLAALKFTPKGSFGWRDYDEMFRHRVAQHDRSWAAIDGELWWLHVIRIDQPHTLNNTKYCFRFQTDSCTRQSCSFAHKCSKCFSPSHGSRVCRRAMGGASQAESTKRQIPANKQGPNRPGPNTN